MRTSAHRNVLHSQPQGLQQLREGALFYYSFAVARLCQLLCDALLPVSVLLLPRLPPLLRFADMRRRLRHQTPQQASWRQARGALLLSCP